MAAAPASTLTSNPNWAFVIGLTIILVTLCVGNTIVIIRRNRKALRRSSSQADIEAKGQADVAFKVTFRAAVHTNIASCSPLREPILVRAISKLPVPVASMLEHAGPAQVETTAETYQSDIKSVTGVRDTATYTAAPRVIVPVSAHEPSAAHSVASIFIQDLDDGDDLVVYPGPVDSSSLIIPELDTLTPSSPSSDFDSTVLSTPTVDVRLPLQQWQQYPSLLMCL